MFKEYSPLTKGEKKRKEKKEELGFHSYLPDLYRYGDR